jgi:nucleotide-binding universal stress UspA family protein
MEAAPSWLDAAADTLRADYPSLHIDAVVQSGPAVEAILAEAEHQHVDAIAVGSHGRTGLAHALLGSTAEKCANKARKPVLVVKVEEAPTLVAP